LVSLLHKRKTNRSIYSGTKLKYQPNKVFGSIVGMLHILYDSEKGSDGTGMIAGFKKWKFLQYVLQCTVMTEAGKE
jgi:hypothetical protein